MLEIIDISDPTNPTQTATTNLGGDGLDIIVDGRLAYVSVQAVAGTCSGVTITGCELKVYDVQNPTSIAAVGGYDNGGDRKRNRP